MGRKTWLDEGTIDGGRTATGITCVTTRSCLVDDNSGYVISHHGDW